MSIIKAILKFITKSFFTAFFILCFIFIIIGGIIGSQMVDVEKIEDNSYIVLEFSEPLTETASSEFSFSKDPDERPIVFFDVMKSLERASFDDRIKFMLIDMNSISMLSREHASELSMALETFKANGKKIYAYGSMALKNSYFLASFADEIIMPPTESAFIGLTGYASVMPYYKDFAEMLGIKVNVIHVGDFKAYGETYAKDEMSDELRSEIIKIRDEILDEYISIVSNNRNIDTDTFKTKLLDGDYAYISPLTEDASMLIDRKMDKEELTKFFDNQYNKPERISIDDYIGASLLEESSSNYYTSSKIAVVSLEGEILPSYQESFMGGSSAITPSRAIRLLKKVKDDDDVKAVVLRINSPGGSALVSELILREIERLKEKKPVVVSMGPVAASGGYYLSCLGDRIFADKYTVTGSIGVVGVLPDFSETAEKLGVNISTVIKGRYTTLGNPFITLSEDEKELLKKRMEGVYREFKGRVIQGRNISDDELESIAQGRVWTGRQALEVGLVDEIGGLKNAIEYTANLAQLNEYEVINMPKPKSFLEKITETDNMIKAVYGDSFMDRLENSLDYVIEVSNKPLLRMPFNIK